MLDRVAVRTLDNGLKIICLKKDDAPIVAVQVWYRTGSAYEATGQRGISHFLEHLMFRGSKNIAAQEHAQRINDAGGHCNAGTAEDVTFYVNTVPREHLRMVFELEADRMCDLEIDNELLETERKVIIEEYHSYMNVPATKPFLEFRSDFYGDHPYAISPLGLLDDIARITPQHCWEYYRRWYSPRNALLVVVGAFDSAGQIFDLAAGTFGRLPARSIEAAAGEEMPQPLANRQMRYMRRRIHFDVPILIMGFPAPPSSAADALPLEILQMAVSQGESSRLYRNIVRKESLAVMASGMNLLLRRPGMSLFFAIFTPDMPMERVARSLRRQIALVKNDGITQAEMEKVRNSTLTSRIFELYSAEHICQRLGFSEIVEGDYRLWVERLNILERLDTDQLTGVARKYWSDDLCHTLYLQPKSIRPMLFAAGLLRRFGMR
jgi:zinc protease